jgi:hypothetical protein
MKKDAAMTRPKQETGSAGTRAPLAKAVPGPGPSGLDVLLHLLPVAGLHLSPPGQPDDETREAGFDNMPV